MSTAETRALLREVLPIDSELDAFCLDYFPEVHRLYALQMDRLTKENLLLEKIPADLLHRRLVEQRAQSEVLAKPSSYGAALGAALRLDRTHQWDYILETSREPDSFVYLLYGQRERAGLAFFVDRLCRFLGPESDQRHRIFKVPLASVDGMNARTGESWALHLQTELATGLGRRAGLQVRELLRLSTARHPFFIVLGRHPLDLRDEAEQEGLREFLTEQLPELMREVPHVRILIAHDYEKPAQSQVKKLDDWARLGAKSGSYRYMKLDEAVLPSWDDVQRYLFKHKKFPEARSAALKPEYDRLRSRKTLSYEALATFLDRKLDT
jgi:hypothetical protein